MSFVRSVGKITAMSGKTAAVALGAIFLIVGLLGFVANSLIGHHALVRETAAFDWERVIMGAVLIGVGIWTPVRAVLWLRILAGLYVIGVLITLVASKTLSRFAEINSSGNWLHLILGLLLIAAALAARTNASSMAATDTSGLSNGVGSGSGCTSNATGGITGEISTSITTSLPGLNDGDWAQSAGCNSGLPYLVNNPPPGCAVLGRHPLIQKKSVHGSGAAVSR